MSLVFSTLILGFLPVFTSSTSFNDGQVSLSKVYVNGSSEVNTLEIGPGDVVKVRLKYNNNSAISAQNVNIQETLPPGFTLVSSSIKNCLLGTKCVSLGDSLVSGSTLNVAPLAGYFNYSNIATSSNLEFGKKAYLYSTVCTQGSEKEIFEQNLGNSSLFLGDCSGTTAGLLSLTNTLDLLGNRYLHQTTCTQTSGSKEIFIQSIDNSTSHTGDCSIAGGSVSGTNTLDLLGNRYLHQTTCTQTSGSKEVFIQSIDNSTSHTGDCSNAGGSISNTNTFDLLDRSRASGYVEYQMKSDLDIDLISYGTTATMTGNSFVNINENLGGSLVLRMFCENILPVNAQRSLTLSDAELRTDQDFTCNYNARLCPVVFQDIDSNGIKNGGDTFIDNTSVQLLASNQITVLDTLNYTSGVSPCFNSTVGGQTYYLKIPTPPTAASTTGGNTLIQYVSYNTGRRDVYFGYTSGELTLSTPASISLSSLQVSTTDTTSSGVVPDITVIDSRLGAPGWTLSATVNNFVATDSSNFTISVAGKLTNTPGTTLITNGNSTGVQPGNVKTVTSTVDPAPILSTSSGNGTGNYKVETGIDLIVPPFVRASAYNSSYIFTLI